MDKPRKELCRVCGGYIDKPDRCKDCYFYHAKEHSIEIKIEQDARGNVHKHITRRVV